MEQTQVEKNINALCSHLEYIKNSSKFLIEEGNVQSESLLWDYKFLTNILEVLKNLKKEKYPLLGISGKVHDCGNKAPYLIITNGVICLGKLSLTTCKNEFSLTLHKTANTASEILSINFCMNYTLRKEAMNEVSKIFYKAYSDKVSDEEFTSSELKNMIENIIDTLIKYNELGTENSYLKEINNMVLKMNN